MTDPGADRLRRALRGAAGDVAPACDGLSRIQARVGRRSRWRPLRRSAAVAFAVSALAGGVLLAGGVITSTDRLGTEDRPPASAGTAIRPLAPPPPSAVPPVPEFLTVWPYSSRREAAVRELDDLATGRRHYLQDARATALRFVQEHLGRTDVTEVVGEPRALAAGIGVTVGRPGPGSSPPVAVTTVYLVRAFVADDAPYVVVSASSPDLRFTAPFVGLDAGAPRVRGTSTAPRRVQVELRVLGSGSVLTTGSAAPTATEWSLPLPPVGGDSRDAALVAVQLGADGRLIAMAVRPVRLR